jgi:hypothetical protein
MPIFSATLAKLISVLFSRTFVPRWCRTIRSITGCTLRLSRVFSIVVDFIWLHFNRHPFGPFCLQNKTLSTTLADRAQEQS